MAPLEGSDDRTRSASLKQSVIASIAIAAILLHLVLRFLAGTSLQILDLPCHELPLMAALLFGGVPLVFDLSVKLWRGEFGSDLQVGIEDVHAGQSPEQKLELVRTETNRANTVFLGDGINDAPANRRHGRDRFREQQRRDGRGGRRGHHGEFP